MKWIACPTCKGTLETKRPWRKEGDADFPGQLPWRKVPCSTCTDSDGNPTGRVCVMSDEQLEGMRDLWHTGFLTKAEADAIEAELSYRKG